MRKRAMTMMLTLVFAIFAAFPVQAADEWVYLEHGDYSVSSSLLEGNKIRAVYLQAGSASYEVYYEFTDQNGYYLTGGTLYPGSGGNAGTPIEFHTPSGAPNWFPTSFGPSVTGIQLTLTCAYSNAPCEAYGYFETSNY